MPRKNTPSADYPQAVLREIGQLAQNIVIARKRRGESQAQWARKLGISQPTMARIERGDPAVAMASYVMCLWLINQGKGLADLIAPHNDHAALEKEVAKVHGQRKSGKQGNRNPPPFEFDGLATAAPHAAVGEHPKSAPSSTTDSRKSLAGTSRLSELNRQNPDAMSDVRKSLASAARRSDLASSRTALGLAALLAGPKAPRP